MAYLDTNVLIAYYFEEDENHRSAEKIVENLRSGRKQPFISPLTLTEIFSVISRNIWKYRLPPHLKKHSERTRVYTLVKLILKALNPNIINDEPRVEQLNNTTVFHIFRRAIDYSSHLKLATLDLLHITYALQLANKGLIDTFVTLNRDMLTKTEPIEKLGLKICAPINAHKRS